MMTFSNSKVCTTASPLRNAEYSKRIVSSPLIPKVHGRFFSKVIKDLRDALGLGSVFSVGLDLDDDVSSKVGKVFILAHNSILLYV